MEMGGGEGLGEGGGGEGDGGVGVGEGGGGAGGGGGMNCAHVQSCASYTSEHPPALKLQSMGLLRQLSKSFRVPHSPLPSQRPPGLPIAGCSSGLQWRV